MALLIGLFGVAAIPIALAVTATLATVALRTVLLVKLRRRMAAGAGP